MTARALSLLVLFATVSPALAQAPLAFEVASVRAVPPSDTPTAALGVRITGSQIRIAALSMKDYLSYAFNVSPKQIEGPDWLAEARFDVTANIPAGVDRDKVPVMLQELLRERFELKIRRERREFPVYALTPARNGRKPTVSTLKEVDASAPVEVTGSGGNNGVMLDLGGGSYFSLAADAITAKHITMVDFADTLTRFVDRTVIDATGMTGRYDVTAKLTREEYDATLLRSALNAGIRLPPQVLRMLDGAPANPVGPALEAAGLAFESRRAPLDVIIVESVLREPRDN
jgi:uncharacterized protein (TIGR03435 family)